MKLIVGLGNPGEKYKNTRHNAGYNFLESYAKANNLEINKKKYNGLYATFQKNNQTIMLLKPEKYMNLSGEVIRLYIEFFKINKDDILIIHDDIDTPLGKIKFKRKGSSGGHNGLKNIEQNLETQEYKRLKIGLSKNSEDNLIDYVIKPMPKKEIEILNQINQNAKEIIDDYLTMDFEKLMNKYN